MQLSLNFFFFIYYIGDGMNLFRRMNQYLVDKNYKITISKKWVHIINYLEIVSLNDTRIVVRYAGGNSVILGKNLIVARMQDEEILIEGEIQSVEV